MYGRDDAPWQWDSVPRDFPASTVSSISSEGFVLLGFVRLTLCLCSTPNSTVIHSCLGKCGCSAHGPASRRLSHRRSRNTETVRLRVPRAFGDERITWSATAAAPVLV